MEVVEIQNILEVDLVQNLLNKGYERDDCVESEVQEQQIEQKVQQDTQSDSVVVQSNQLQEQQAAYFQQNDSVAKENNIFQFSGEDQKVQQVEQQDDLDEEDEDKENKQGTLGSDGVEQSAAIKTADTVLNMVLETILKEKKKISDQIQNKENSQQEDTQQIQKEKEISKEKECSQQQQQALKSLMQVGYLHQSQGHTVQSVQSRSRVALQQQENLSLQATRVVVASQTRQVSQNSQNLQNFQNSQNSCNSQKEQKLGIREVIEIVQKEINFGVVVAGNIFEESLEITNKWSDSVVLKVVVTCTNKEFEEHDEYVYSIRKTVNYDYNEKYAVLLPPGKTIFFKVALKVPNVQMEQKILGNVHITLQGLNGQNVLMPISAHAHVPQLVCTKQLYAKNDDINLIKLAIKKGKKTDSKIPFKSLHVNPAIFEAEWLEIQNPTNNNEITNNPYEIIIHPQSLSVQPKGMFIINVIVKNNPRFNSNLENENNLTQIRKVLQLKIKNSNVHFYFPVLIDVY